jgi:tRNA threonylcarbamoyladenosine biosynthesis protein TsaB
MTTLLAVDTSTDACSVALLHKGNVYEDFRVIPRQHTKQVLPMIDALLKTHQLTVQDLDAIAFGRGPGSFAGIRIATGVAQGLAFGAEKPVIPVSTLASIAYQRFQEGAQHVVAALDARMDEVYWGAFENIDGYPVVIEQERVNHPERVSLPFDAQWEGAGSGWGYASSMSALVQEKVATINPDVYPTASAMVRLAERAWQKGETVAPEEALPVYLRDDVAWKKKDQQ